MGASLTFAEPALLAIPPTPGAAVAADGGWASDESMKRRSKGTPRCTTSDDEPHSHRLSMMAWISDTSLACIAGPGEPCTSSVASTTPARTVYEAISLGVSLEA